MTDQTQFGATTRSPKSTIKPSASCWKTGRAPARFAHRSSDGHPEGRCASPAGFRERCYRCSQSVLLTFVSHLLISPMAISFFPDHNHRSGKCGPRSPIRLTPLQKMKEISKVLKSFPGSLDFPSRPSARCREHLLYSLLFCCTRVTQASRAPSLLASPRPKLLRTFPELHYYKGL